MQSHRLNLRSQTESKLEPVKIIQIGKLIDSKFIGFESQFTKEVYWSFGQYLWCDDFLRLMGNTSTDVLFEMPMWSGGGSDARRIQVSYNFPRLKEISEVGKLVNLVEFYSEFIFDAVDLGTVTGAESGLPHSNGLQRYWCLSDDLVWVNRPCRSSEDYQYIKLKVEEFVLEKRDEYSALIRKVERLRKILDNNFHGSREFPTDDVLAFVMKRDEEKCVLCDSREFLQFDHIYPRSKGGSDETGNLRILCRTCNSKRGNLNS